MKSSICKVSPARCTLFRLLCFLAAIPWVTVNSKTAAMEGTAQSLPVSGAATNFTGSKTLARMPAYRMILIPPSGSGKGERTIRYWQKRVAGSRNLQAALERLGWAFVACARANSDSGYYKLAEQCAACLDQLNPACPESLLLKGHVLHSLHHFHESEEVARELVAARGLSEDHALLGDALMEQGRLSESAVAYQEMVDLKPGLQAYSRIGHLRWLKGDLEGAIAVLEMAAKAASPVDPESLAWVHVRLGNALLQAGNRDRADVCCRIALQHMPGSPGGLILRARLLLAAGKKEEALPTLERAMDINPLPEVQWLYADALRSDGRIGQAESVEESLETSGASSDPRTFALYLATRGKQADRAVELARAELKAREDVFTRDALAWALHAAGKPEQAAEWSRRSLSEGTEDARLFFHAGIIAADSGRLERSRHWLRKAREHVDTLMPSEQKQLFETCEKQSFELESKASNHQQTKR